MSKSFTITLPDDLEQALIIQSQSLNQSPEAIIIESLSQQLKSLLFTPLETDPLLQLIGSIQIDIPDLAEKHDDYIGQAFYQELIKDEESIR